MHVQELLFASASWQLRGAFCRALALNPARRKNFFSRFYFHRYISLKICRQNYSTGQIKVQQGVTLSVWIAYIIVWRFFRLHRFYPFLVISIVSDSSFVSLLSVAVWRSFTNDHRVILRDRRKHVRNYSDNKIAVPLSVFVSRSLIYTLGT